MDDIERTINQIVADLRKFVTAGANIQHKGLNAVGAMTTFAIAQQDGTINPLRGARSAIRNTLDRIAQREPRDSPEPRLSHALEILFGFTGIRDVRARKAACNKYYYPSPYGGAKYQFEAFDRRWYPKLLESLAFTIVEWEEEYRKQRDQIENVSLLTDSTEVITEVWRSGFWLLFWLKFHLEETLGELMVYLRPVGAEESSKGIARTLYHAFVASEAVRKIADIEESRFSFLHLGPRMAIERTLSGLEPRKFFSLDDERWLRHFFVRQPHYAGLVHDDLAKTPGGILVLERFRVLADYCPCAEVKKPQDCLRHFLLLITPQLCRSIDQSWSNAGNVAATYFGARMKTTTVEELWRPDSD